MKAILQSVKKYIVIEGIDNIESLRDSNIVIVEDVVDTGRTMNQLVKKLNMFSPKRILIACLLKKRSKVQCYQPHYIGFQECICCLDIIHTSHLWMLEYNCFYNYFEKQHMTFPSKVLLFHIQGTLTS